MNRYLKSVERRTRTAAERNSHQNGQALVEFMLTAVFIVLLTVAILEVAVFIYTYGVLANASNEGVRYAVVHGADSSSPSGPTSGTASTPPCNSANATTGSSVTAVQSAATNFAAFSLHSTSLMNVYVCYLSGNNSLGSQVEVSLSYPYQPFFFKWPSVTVFANSSGRIVY